MLNNKFFMISRARVAQVVGVAATRVGSGTRPSRVKTSNEFRLISNDFVGFNVGGKIYETTRATLTRYPNSFFATMVKSGFPSVQDTKGNYLIDRDGELFRHVLNFMRSGELVLPERFNELSLLEREADFFLLQELKNLITQRLQTCEAMGVGLMFDNGRVFNTKRETLMKEENSFFNKMLSGEVKVARDPQGNYIMDRDGRLFQHVMSYLRDGGIFNAIESHELRTLETDAEYFNLKVLAAHVESIRSLQNKWRDNKSNYSYNRRSAYNHLHFYYCVDGPCVAYTNSPYDRYNGMSDMYDGGNYGRHTSNKSSVMDKLFSNTYAVIDSVQSGVVNMDEIKGKGPASIQDVMFYFKRSVGQHKIPQHRLNGKCTRLEFDL